jgi:hypothetical protein
MYLVCRRARACIRRACHAKPDASAPAHCSALISSLRRQALPSLTSLSCKQPDDRAPLIATLLSRASTFFTSLYTFWGALLQDDNMADENYEDDIFDDL